MWSEGNMMMRKVSVAILMVLEIQEERQETEMRMDLEAGKGKKIDSLLNLPERKTMSNPLFLPSETHVGLLTYRTKR
jgi:hypothetical protein